MHQTWKILRSRQRLPAHHTRGQGCRTDDFGQSDFSMLKRQLAQLAPGLTTGVVTGRAFRKRLRGDRQGRGRRREAGEIAAGRFEDTLKSTEVRMERTHGPLNLLAAIDKLRRSSEFTCNCSIMTEPNKFAPLTPCTSCRPAYLPSPAS